jgi:hypothetical protein
VADLLAPPATELSKIGVATYPTPGQGLALDSSGKIPKNVGVPIVLGKTFDSPDITSTAAETSFANSLIPAGILGTSGSLEYTIFGDYVYNQNTSLIFKVAFGGSTLYKRTYAGSATIGANRQPWYLKVILGNLGSTSNQFLGGYGALGAPTDSAPTNGIGTALFLTPSTIPLGNFGGTGSVDTTLDNFLVLSVQWGASTSNVSWRKKYAVLELF